jgi:hypothetical protein
LKNRKEFRRNPGTLSFYHGNVRRNWEKYQATQSRQIAIVKHRSIDRGSSADAVNNRNIDPKSREMIKIRNIITGSLDESPVNPGKIWHRF